MRRVRRLSLCLILAAAAGCAHGPPPALRSAPLVVEDSPRGVLVLVRAKVAGEPLMLVLDTGAPQSVLPARFARERKLRTRSSASAPRVVDVNGNVMAMPMLPGVPVQFEGEPAGGTIDFLMNPSSSVALLAPQDLVRRGWALVIDIGGEELRHEPEEAALERLEGDGAVPRKVEFRRCLDEGLFERSHRVVRAMINGIPAKMLIDTGAARTILSRNNPALPSMVSMLGEQGTMGGVVSVGQGLLVDPVPVVFSDTPFTMPVVVSPASNSCWDGALGADVLRHCTLVWGWSSLWASCRAPSGG